RPYRWVTFAPMTVKRVGIVGSGIMGSGIAEVAAKAGHEVVLRSRKQETADSMVAGLEKSLTKQVEKGRLSDEDRQGTLQRVTADDETIAEVRAFAEACGKAPVEVKDQAGFIVNALLFPYLNNAVRLLENGVATRDDIDEAMKGGCNFPMGPLALLDLVGLDTSLAIIEALYAEFRDPNYAPVPLLKRMVAAEQLGRKSGKAFH